MKSINSWTKQLTAELRAYRLVKLIFMILFFSARPLLAQTSSGNGSWTTGSNWIGGVAPPTSGQSSGSIVVNNILSIAGAYSATGSTSLEISSTGSLTINASVNFAQLLTIDAGGSMSISGDLLLNGGATINVYGTLMVQGNVTLNSNLNIQPGGKVIVAGSLNVNNAQYLNVGTAVAPPPNADLVVEGDLNSFSSGDVVVNENGRVVIYGNVSDNGGGGTIIQVNSGGQTYVNGNINYSGGGSSIIAPNTTPLGLFVNGSITNSGGGSTTTTFTGSLATLESTDPAFFNWIASQSNSPLPITLLYFAVDKVTENNVSLKWSTASELNFDHFEIQRSTDGKNFNLLGTVPGKGTTTRLQTYGYSDIDPIVGRNYYLLRAIDFDGISETFNVIVVDHTSQLRADIYPNPLNGNSLYINLNFEDNNETFVAVMDITGKVIFTSRTRLQQFTIFPCLQNGFYIVTITKGAFKHSHKLVVE